MSLSLEVLMATGRPDREPAVSTHLRTGFDRRRTDRREAARGRHDRRRGDRRRAGALAGLLAGSLGLVAHRGLQQPTARSAPSVTAPAGSPDPSPTPEAPASPYERFIQEASALYDVSADLVRAVIQTESNFNPRAVSGAGARGLMQLTPVTLRELKMTIDPFNPRENILAGTRYLGMMLDRHDGNVPLALASYNAGPTAVRRHRGIPPFKETRGYVKKVQRALAEAAETADEPMAD
jgi:soluble lytic murein transglycosylase-like protein